MSSKDINYDVRKTFNAKLEGNQAKTFFKTNPRPAKTPDFKNHSRVMELPNDYILHPFRFENNVNLDAIPDYKMSYHSIAPVLSKEKMRVSKQQLVQDYIHGRNNMYNDLEPVRCALRPEPIIPAGSYLRGLLSEPKSTISAGIVPLTSGVPPPPAGPSDDYGKDNYAIKQYDKKLVRDAYKIDKAFEKEVKENQQAIEHTNRRLRGESKPMMNPTDKIIKFGGTIQKKLGFEDKPGSTIEKARIGQPVNSTVLGETKAITDLEDRLGEKTKEKIIDAQKYVKDTAAKIQAVGKGRLARQELAKLRKQKKMSDDVIKVQALFKGRQLRKKMNIQEEPLDIPQGKSKATIQSQDTTAGEKGDIPRTVLIKVDDFIANYVNKDTPIKFENMKGSDALTLTQKRDTPIGVKAFANLYRYTNLYWDTKADGERLTLKQRLQNNNMNFNSKEDFLNTFNIDTRKLTSDAIKAKASASKAGPSRRSQPQ